MHRNIFYDGSSQWTIWQNSKYPLAPDLDDWWRSSNHSSASLWIHTNSHKFIPTRFCHCYTRWNHKLWIVADKFFRSRSEYNFCYFYIARLRLYSAKNCSHVYSFIYFNNSCVMQLISDHFDCPFTLSHSHEHVSVSLGCGWQPLICLLNGGV